MMGKYLFKIMLVLLGLQAGNSIAQEVRGVVRDKDGETLPGVSVLIVGTTQGVSTDIDGNFVLRVDNVNNDVLRFSFIGMKPQEIALNGRTELVVVLESESTALDEVVVVGYGTQRRSDLTGAVASVSGQVLAQIPVTSAAEAITGRMAGVQVTTTEGSPDADVKIRVRSGGSISQDNSPLFIVDGFPVSSISNIPPTDIQSIDVLKDASSTAIYGARGANGVVIVTTKSGSEGKITVNFNAYWGVKVKKKSIGVLSPYEYVLYQHELDPTSDSGTTSTFNTYYGDYHDLNIYRSVRGTDWQDEVFGKNALQQNYNVSISGGTKASRYNLSLTHTDEDNIMINSGFKRSNVNFKLNSEINKYVSVDFNTRVAYTIVDGAGTASDRTGASSKLRNAVKYAPTKGLRDFSDSTIADDDVNSPESASLLYDPIESVVDEYKKQKRISSNFNGAINIKPISGITIRSEWGYAIHNNRTDYVWGPATYVARQYAGQPVGRIYTYEGSDWRTANTITWQKDDIVAGHNINLMVGQEVTSAFGKSVTSESRYFPHGLEPKKVLAMFGLGTPIATDSQSNAKENLSSFFGRLNYTILDRYLFTVTFRADGSSKFAKDNRWGFFPSAAFAWRVSEESFMLNQADWLSNLKLRLSYGTAGNNRIDSGLWRLSYSTDDQNKPYYAGNTPNGQLIPGTTLANPDLKWETTHTANLGIDYGIFRNRVSGSIELYYNRTKDLLIDQPVPESTGYTTQMKNIGETSNRGLELMLEGVILDDRDYSLSASFNIAFNKNKVEKFRNGEFNYKTYSSGWNGSAAPTSDFIVQEGKEIGLMYGYVTEGMYSFDDFTFDNTTNTWLLNDNVASNQTLLTPGNYFGPGALKFKNMNPEEDMIIDEKDKIILGSAQPKHTGGFNITGRWKGIDASIFFNWSYGNKVYNANKLDYTAQLASRKYQNLSDEMVLANRFTTIDPTTGYNIYYGRNANPERLREINQGKTMWSPLHTTTVLHSYAIEDGSFLRLNNLTVGYSLPYEWVSKVSLQNVRFYFTGYNLAIWTNYTGFDPEVDTRRSTPLTPSVDFSAYPKSRQYIFGLNVTF